MKIVDNLTIKGGISQLPLIKMLRFVKVSGLSGGLRKSVLFKLESKE